MTPQNQRSRPNLGIALIVLSVGCLVLLLFRDGTESVERRELGPADSEEGELSVGVDHLADLPAAGRFNLAIERRTWSVQVIDEKGQPLNGAQITAARGGQRLEATDLALWEEPLPGDWVLTVASPGLPVWKKSIDVATSVSTKTTVQLAKGVLISGRVRYADDGRCDGRFVGFVPKGERAPLAASKWLELPHARTDRDGRFQLLLPESGSYRAFVGWGGNVLFEESRPQSHAPGGFSYLDVVLPAPTRLVVEVKEAETGRGRGGLGVSLYRRKELMEAELQAKRTAMGVVPRAQRPLHTAPSAPPSTLTTLTEEEQAEANAAEEARARAEERAKDPDERRRRALRMAVVPEGYGRSMSGATNQHGRIIFENVATGEELRFALGRGTEAFAVTLSAWLDEGDQARLEAEIPAAMPQDAPMLDAPRTATASLQVAPHATSGAEPGARWR